MEFWFHHVGVSVSDLDRAVAWYDEMLGFSLERRFFLEAIPAEIAVLRNGPLHVELFRVPEPVPASAERHVPNDDVRTCGTKHVAFSCASVGDMLERLKARGADIALEKRFPDGRAAIFIRDCEGNLIEFVQFPAIEGAGRM